MYATQSTPTHTSSLANSLFSAQVEVAAIVAGAVNASIATLGLLSEALILQANQTLALLTLLGNLNLGGMSGLATLTDLATVQFAVKNISTLDLVRVVDALLASAPQVAKRDSAFLATGLLDDPTAMVAIIESLVGTVEDLVASVAYIILQQLEVADLKGALEGSLTAA